MLLSFYDALGVERNAPPDVIRSAYKKQSLALHPDKNANGKEVMKFVNEAYRVLSDTTKRARYDREDVGSYHGGNGNGSNGNGGRGGDPSAPVVRALRRQLSEAEDRRLALERRLEQSERKRSKLIDKFAALQELVDDRMEGLERANSLLSAREKEAKRLENQLHYSGQERKRVQNEADYLRSKVEILEEDNSDKKRRIDAYETKMEKTNRALREERRKSSDELARAEERADSLASKVERVTREMSERSVCYRCNGSSTSEEDCAICMGTGAVQGIWTRCNNCDGAGAVAPIIGDEKVACATCSSRGAREGTHSVTCFKCMGRDGGRGCDTCYRGRIRGFNLRLCPFCKGKDERCENCLGRAHVSCRCGPSCAGHGLRELSPPATPSSLQRRLALTNEADERDWSAVFLTRNWMSPL